MKCVFTSKVWDLAPLARKPKPDDSFQYEMPPSRGFSERECVEKALSEARVWQEVKAIKSSHVPSLILPLITDASVTLSAKQVQILSDAAWHSSSRLGGAAWVFKDSSDAIVLQGSSPLLSVCSALAAEALSLQSSCLPLKLLISLM